MGVYLYCIMRVSDVSPRQCEQLAERHGVRAIVSEDLLILAGSVGPGGHAISREALMSHESVVKSAFELGPVIPFAFGTIASSEEDARKRILVRNKKRIGTLLRKIAGKVELTLRVVYRRAELIEDIMKSRPEIKSHAEELKRTGKITKNDQIEIGRMIAEAIEDRRTKDAGSILDELTPLCDEYHLKPLLNDLMVLNAAFLVDTRNEAEFDRRVDRAYQPLQDVASFMYAGPSVPYHFTRLTIT